MSCKSAFPFICGIAAAGVLLIARCSTTVTGTSSGAEARMASVKGTVVDNNGGASPHSFVRLVPASYDPATGGPLGDSLTDTTDGDGVYEIKVSDSGAYNVQVLRPSDGTRGLAVRVHVAQDTTLAPVTLSIPGAIEVILPQAIASAGGYIYLLGTTFTKRLSTSGGTAAVLDSVPAGLVPGLYYEAPNSGAVPQLITSGLVVAASDTAVVLFNGWQYSLRMVLNTSVSGAGVAGTVTQFPILVRLTKANFNFARAQRDGADIRFATMSGASLPYEIERWDSTNGAAEIWVKIDTIYGNNSSQAIRMYFGNPSASSASSGASVFDTASGFRAVYHMSSFNDATANGYNGSNFGSSDTAGLIGVSKEFHGKDSIVIPSRMGTPGVLTISAWANLYVRDSAGAEVVSLNDAAVIRVDDIGNPTSPSGTKGSYHWGSNRNDYYITSSGQTLANTGWHYLVYTIDTVARQQVLTIDGTKKYITSYTPGIFYSPNGKSTYIGAHGNDWGFRENGFSFIGAIDEVRICGVARSADWIALCYMNQKPADALVSIK
jgi:hypothetical protein